MCTCTCLTTFSCTAVCSLIFPFQLEGTVGATHLRLNKHIFQVRPCDREHTKKIYSFIHNVFQVCFCPQYEEQAQSFAKHRIGVKVFRDLGFFSNCLPVKAQVQDARAPHLLLSESCISSAHLPGTGGDSRSCGCVVLGSVSQQGTRRCSATESHTAVGRVAAQHFCLFADSEDGAVLVERTHCGAQNSAGEEKPT